MSKIIALVVFSALALFPNIKTRTSLPSTPLADRMEVMVLFSGLMVFNKYPEGSYEVGILGPALSKDHDFCVQRLGAGRICREKPQPRNSKRSHSQRKKPPAGDMYLPNGPKWTIEVAGGDPPNETPLGAAQKEKHRPDVEGKQFDFGWIINLDGDKFHNEKLELKPNLLQPIIKLPKVKLFTKYKSPDFYRHEGAKKELFGFVAETIGFRVQLKKGQELVLREEPWASNPLGTVITRVPYVAPSDDGGDYEVVIISNARYPPHEKSDFHTYYQLFSNARDFSWYDFEENKKEPCEPGSKGPCLALNPSPKYTVAADRTCCGLVCTEILLTQWGKPLH